MKTFAILFAIFIISIIVLADLGYMKPQLKFMNDIPYGDKIGHFFLIGTLNFLITSSLIQSLPSHRPGWVAVSAALFLAVLFTIEEASQGPIHGRDASWGDLFMNYIGITFFGFLAWFVNRK